MKKETSLPLTRETELSKSNDYMVLLNGIEKVDN